MKSIVQGRHREVYRLRENELDLQTELNDLNDEIATRMARVGTVLRLLRETRENLAALEARAA